ncbi:TPA: OprD family outer membrane porin [Photobacterium damselae]
MGIAIPLQFKRSKYKNFINHSALLSTISVYALLSSQPLHASVFSDLRSAAISNANVSMVLLNHAKTTEKYFKDNKKDIDGMDRQYEWGQAIGLFYRSGNLPIGITGVTAGIDVGYSYMFNLADKYPGNEHQWNAGEKIFMSEDCYWTGKEPGTGQYRCASSSGYGKLPVANIRFNWGKDIYNRGFLRIGDGFYNTGMITAATDDDALLSSYRGITTQFAVNNWLFDGGYVTGFMSGNGDKMEDLTGNANYYDIDPLKYDYLYTARVRKKFGNGAGFQVAYGEAQDYLRRSMASAYYTLNIAPQTNLFTQAQYYYNKKAGHLWEEDVADDLAAFDDYASLISYEFRLNYHSLQLLYGFTKVHAPSESKGVGSFSYGFGNAKGYLKLPTSGNYHGFRRDGEEAHVLGLRYYISAFNLDNMYLEYRYHWGKTPVKTKLTGDIDYGKEEEHAITASYEPQTGLMKGFVFNLKQAFYRPDEIVGQIGINDIKEKADRTATKFIMSYKFNL